MKRPIKRPPRTGDIQLDRILTEVYNNIAELADASVSPDVRGNQPHNVGDGGEIRLVKGDDKQYYLQARFKDGWVSTAKGMMAFQNTAADEAPALFAGTAPRPGTIFVENNIQEEVDNVVALAVAL